MENMSGKITKFKCQANRLTPAGIQQLFRNTAVMPQIIDLSENLIGSEGIRIISEALEVNNTK